LRIGQLQRDRFQKIYIQSVVERVAVDDEMFRGVGDKAIRKAPTLAAVHLAFAESCADDRDQLCLYDRNDVIHSDLPIDKNVGGQK
jgi:hypothetical protein